MKMVTRVKAVLFAGLLPAFLLITSVSTPSNGQSRTVPGASAISAEMTSSIGRNNEALPGQSPRITLNVKDSTLRWVLDEISRQAGLKPMYNASPGDMARKVTVNLDSAAVSQAFTTALSGSGLEARITSDGASVMIRNSRQTVDSVKGSVSGRVLDSATKRGIEGVTVLIAGTRLNAVTGENGTFIIPDVPVGMYDISARLIGYQTRRARAVVDDGQSAAVTITMPAAPTALSEVLTTVTGSQRRVEISNDIAKINPEVIMARTPVRNMTDLIEAAQVPGVLVTRSSGDVGSAARIRIRGIGSISQSNDPVVIVDGVWIEGTGGTPSRLDDIDPSSIESMEIVRGPSAATLYGQDAANGVIVITTKKGQAGATRWDISYNRDWGEVPGRKPVTYVGWGHDMWTSRRTPCSIKLVLQFSCLQDSVAIIDPNHPLHVQEGSAVTHRTVLSVDGGTQAIRYRITGTINDELGARRTAPIERIRMRLLNYKAPGKFLEPNHLSRRNISANFTLAPRDNLDLMFVISGNQSDHRDNTVSGDYFGEQLAGFLTGYIGSMDTTEFLTGTNTILEEGRTNRTTTGLLSFRLNWRPVPWGNMELNTGLERTALEGGTSDFTKVCPAGSACMDTTGRRTVMQETRSVYTVRFNASGRPSLGSVDRFLELRPAIGADFRKNENSGVQFSRNNIPAGEISMAGGTVTSAMYTRYAIATAGWYLNTTVGLFRRVYFDIGIRQDIGSAITSSSNTRYPKIGGSWLISDESFWPRNDWIGTLRLRSAVGYAAVQPDVTDINGQYVTGYAYVDGRFVSTAEFARAGNPFLIPERAMEVEVGFDTDMLHDRLQLGVTFAQKDNRNSLVNRNLAYSSGIASAPRKENVGRVLNRSVEVTGSARAIENRDMLLMLDYTLTLLDNQVKHLGDRVMPYGTSATSRIVAGYPIGGIWGPAVLGYHDRNGDGLLAPDEIVRSDSLIYIGWSQPKYRAGYGASLTLRNSVTLDMRMAYQSQYVQSYGRYGRLGMEDVNASLEEQSLASVTELRGGRRPISDLRFTSASLTYQVPLDVTRRLRARTLSVSLQGSNLGLWTNYRGRDPGVNSSAFSEGLQDNGAVMPSPRQYTLSFRWGI